MEKLYIVSKTRLEADHGSDHELLSTQLRFKLIKVGKPLGNSCMMAKSNHL